MERRKQTIALVLFIIVVFFLAWFFVGKFRESGGSEYVAVGAILPLTGDAAQWGGPARNGAQLAVDEINAQGGVRGGTPLKLLAEDTTCTARDGVSAFDKLVATARPFVVVGAVCSSVTLAVAPVAERNGVVLVSPASTNPDITNAGQYVFRVVPSDTLRGQVFAEYLFNTRKYRRVAMLYINNEGGVGNRNAFRQRFEGLGGEILAEEAYAQDAIDVRSQLTRIKAAEGAEAVVVVSYPRDTVVVLRQIRELGIEKPLFFQTEAVEDANVLREAAETAEGVTYILPAPPEGPSHEEFRQAYRERHGSDPELFAAESYDIVFLIRRYLEDDSTVEVTSDGLRDYLYNVTSYPGASGVISFDKNGDVVKPMAIKEVQGGVPVIITTVGS